MYVWGGGGEGQLGLGEETEEMHKPVNLELGTKAVCISCGYYHTAIVTGKEQPYFHHNLAFVAIAVLPI